MKILLLELFEFEKLVRFWQTLQVIQQFWRTSALSYNWTISSYSPPHIFIYPHNPSSHIYSHTSYLWSEPKWAQMSISFMCNFFPVKEQYMLRATHIIFNIFWRCIKAPEAKSICTMFLLETTWMFLTDKRNQLNGGFYPQLKTWQTSKSTLMLGPEVKGFWGDIQTSSSLSCFESVGPHRFAA